MRFAAHLCPHVHGAAWYAIIRQVTTVMTDARESDLPECPPPARGSLIVLSGPSGVGKDAVLAPLFSAGTCPPRLRRCITATTRAPRPGEVEGVDYFFLSNEEFQRRSGAGFFLEHASYAGRWYGTPRWWVEAEVAGGNDVLLKIDVQGALQIRSQVPEAVLIFIAPPSEAELERRLRGREPDADPDDLARRLAIALEELARARQYDYLVVNARLEKAVEDLRAIIIAERCRVRR
jgi:guanylate kinase